MSTPPRRVRTAEQKKADSEAMGQAMAMGIAALFLAMALYALVYMMIALALTVLSILAVSFLVAALVGLYWRVRIICTGWSRRRQRGEHLELIFGLSVDQYRASRRSPRRVGRGASGHVPNAFSDIDEDSSGLEWDLRSTSEADDDFLTPPHAQADEEDAFTFLGPADLDSGEVPHGRP